MGYAETLRAYQAQVNGALEALPMAGAPDILRQAMRYSLLAGGKRLRGVLALAACQMAGGKAADALPFACALEMIHAYSLIHDDLPAMDNDTLRRGKPTNHVVYGEAVAILAGDGLLTHAFELMAAQTHPAAFAALGEIARAAGIGGMLRGQTLDVTLEGTRPIREQVEQIHLGKTAAMITAPVTAGLLLAGASPDQIAAGREYGKHLGVAFQIVDDLLDLEGDPAVLADIDKYIEYAKTTKINAFVVNIMDGTSIGYNSPVYEEYSPTAYQYANNTVEEYRQVIQKIKDAGFYAIGRLTVFNDSFFCQDHPEYAIADQSGEPLMVANGRARSAATCGSTRSRWRSTRSRPWASTRSSSTTSASRTGRTNTRKRAPSTSATNTARPRRRPSSGF